METYNFSMMDTSNSSTKISSKASWSSLFFFTRTKHAPAALLAVLTAFCAGILVPAFAIFLGKVFNSFIDSGSGAIENSQLHREVKGTCFVLIGLAAATWILDGSYYASWIAFGELQANNARETMFDSLVVKDLAWYDTKMEGVGGFFVQVERNLHDLQIAISQPLGTSVQFSLRMCASLGLALYTSPELTLVILAGVPFFIGIIAFLTTRVQPVIKQQKKEITKASKIVHDSILGIDTIKCFNAQEFEYRQYSSSIRASAYWYMKQARLSALRISSNNLLMFSMFSQGFWYGSILVKSNQISAGDLVRTFWACMTAVQSFAQIVNNFAILERGRVAGSTLKEICKNNKRISSRITPCYVLATNSACKGKIRFLNVSFSYPSQQELLALNSVDLDIRPGELTFIVGPSGSGKSTIGNLICLFYPSFIGTILIDDLSIRTIGTDWLRRNITLVHQQSFLYNETLLENITLAVSNPTDISKRNDKELQAAIKAANLFDVIQNLPQGLETVVGGGSNLSGGQKQRVAIARARLRNTPILILDECTSALDQTNRNIVMNEIRKWRKGRTTIIITHDLDQIFDDDFVYVLNQGRVVQSGSRKELNNLDNPNFQPTRASANVNTIEDAVASSNTLEIGGNIQGCLSECVVDSSPSSNPETVHSLDRARDISPNAFADKQLPQLPSPLSEARLRNYGDDTVANGSLKVERSTHIKSRGSSFQSSQVSSESKQEPESRAGIREILATHISSWHSLLSFKKMPVISCKATDAPFIGFLHCVFSSFSSKRRIALIAGLSCAIAHGAAYPTFSYLLSRLLQTYYAKNYGFSEVAKWPLAIFGVGIFDALLLFLMNYLLEDAGQHWVDTMRRQAMRGVLNQPRSWFDLEINKASHLSSTLDRNAEDTRDIIGKFVGYILAACTILCLALLWSLGTSWKLTVVIVGCGPVILAITVTFRKVSDKWEFRCNEMNEMTGSVFSETFADIRTLKAFTLESYFRSKLTARLEAAWKLGLKRAVYSGIIFGLSQSIIFLMSALLFYYGTVLVTFNQITVGEMFTVFAVLLFSMGYASILLSWIPQYSSACGTASHLIRLSSLPTEKSHEHQGKLRLYNPLPVRFHHVYFQYPSRPQSLVLCDLSLTISPNTCTALVGPSGSGKSTIVSLLLGLYPLSPENGGEPRGSITLGGLDIRNLHVVPMRSRICLVPQQPQIFAGTIRHNITYGLNPLSPLASLSNVRATAKRAGLDDFIMSLPEGYSTLVGDGGVILSGGQAQRLVIARALVRQPQVLILDEATSSLDRENTKHIRETVRQLVMKRGYLTVVMITHDPQMMQMADRVILIEQGSVVEEGAYDLLKCQTKGKLSQMLATINV